MLHGIINFSIMKIKSPDRSRKLEYSMNIATMKIFQKKQEILSNHSNLISKFFVE